MGRSHESRHAALVLWITLLVILGLDTHGNFAGSGDEAHYAMIAHSLVFDGDFDLSDDYGEANNLVGGGQLQANAHVRIGRNGIVRPVHDVGLPIVAAPYFIVAWGATRLVQGVVPQHILSLARLNPPLVFRHFLSFGVIILTAFMARRFLQLLQTQARSVDALVWTLLVVLSPPILSHSFLFFTELPAAAITTWLYATMVTIERDDPNVAMVRDIALGVGIGFLPLLHLRLSGLAVGFIALYLWRRGYGAWRSSVAVFAPVIALAGVKVTLNEVFWGTLVTSPHVRLGAEVGVSSVVVAVERFMGLLFDQAHGLLTYAPLYLTLLPGGILLWRTGRRRCAELLMLIASYVIPVAIPALNAHGWQGGWAPAARFLVPICPLLTLVSFSCIAQRGRWTSALALLAGLQMALDVAYWSHPKILWNDVGASSALLKWMSPAGFDLSPWFPAWGSPSTYTVLVSIALLLLWVLISIWAARRVSGRRVATGDVAI
jgi:hypothetical protein